VDSSKASLWCIFSRRSGKTIWPKHGRASYTFPLGKRWWIFRSGRWLFPVKLHSADDKCVSMLLLHEWLVFRLEKEAQAEPLSPAPIRKSIENYLSTLESSNTYSAQLTNVLLDYVTFRIITKLERGDLIIPIYKRWLVHFLGTNRGNYTQEIVCFLANVQSTLLDPHQIHEVLRLYK